ncbi:MAG: 50S ribosomal protein L21 [Elusimicrobia bacterium]|nr:50S ribosomal protein L21 [Elusimicrobiota bacterium]
MPKAIVSFGSHQYEVEPGGRLQVLRLKRPIGEEFEWDKILAVAPDGGEKRILGAPHAAGAKVRFRVLRHLRGEKVVIFKKRSKKAWKKKTGFRSELTELEVLGVESGAN